MTILVINGPNLNLLGERDPEIYGSRSLKDLALLLTKNHPGVNFRYFQSNSEGEIIDAIQETRKDPELTGIIINPGAYAHYSYAIADAIRDAKCTVAEVHISNIHAREDFRARSVTAAAADFIISGAGLEGYSLAAKYMESQAACDSFLA